MKSSTNISKLPRTRVKLWCLTRLRNWPSNMMNSNPKFRWSATCVANIGIPMCNKEVSNTSPFSVKVNKFKRKYFHKILSLPNNNSKPTLCWKNSPRNPAQPSFKLIQLLQNLQSVKAQLNLLHKQPQVMLQTMQQAIRYRLIHALRRRSTGFVQIWSIYWIYLEN